jgi:hypothetical protein
MTKRNWNRRKILKAIGAVAAGSAAGLPTLTRVGRAFSAAPKADNPAKFLIVIGGLGGASIVDSFLPVKHSECTNFANVNSYYDSEVVEFSGSKLRALDRSGGAVGALPFPWQSNLSEFVTKHRQQMLVATTTGTSVNHVVAQKRSITGNNAWNGRTLQECVAAEWGADYPVPNVNMGAMGFLERGADAELPSYAFGEAVAQPALWSLSLDGVKGIRGAPDRSLVDLARSMRNDKLDPESAFYRTFYRSKRLQTWLLQRGMQADLEAQDLITKLNMFTDSPQYPLGEYGLQASPDAAMLQSVFPLMDEDPLEAQAALAYLLIKNRVSVTVTISPTFNLILTESGELPNPPLAFDYSHNGHQNTQAVMWKRVLSVADRLIDLLSSVEYDSDTGESFWDRSLIYVATDFGRSRGRQAPDADFGSGHHLNNGVVVLSPMVKGDTVLGNVDKQTALTYGWDRTSGADLTVNDHNPEADVFAGILRALGVDTAGSGLPTVDAMIA